MTGSFCLVSISKGAAFSISTSQVVLLVVFSSLGSVLSHYSWEGAKAPWVVNSMTEGAGLLRDEVFSCVLVFYSIFSCLKEVFDEASGFFIFYDIA